MRKIGLVLLVLVLALAQVAAAEGNPKKGKYLFKKECKSCHGDSGAGGKITPLAKTQGQWDRFFDKDLQKSHTSGFGSLTEKDLKDIHQFLRDHAADSDQPETCG